MDDFARIIASFEQAAEKAKAEVVRATAEVTDATRKLASVKVERDMALAEVDQALELLRQAPHRIADVLCAEADGTHEAHSERKAALLDAARIARGVSL